MSSREVRVVVLFEDDAHDRFLRRLVDKLNLRPERYQRCDDSSGVLRRMVTEVDALRARNYQKNCGLVVMIDANGKGLQGRLAELEQRIERDCNGARKPDERIALLVPALEIENWYVHLCCPTARPTSESHDYKQHPQQWRQLGQDLAKAAREAIAAWPPEPGRSDPPSLSAARQELQRLR